MVNNKIDKKTKPTPKPTSKSRKPGCVIDTGLAHMAFKRGKFKQTIPGKPRQFDLDKIDRKKYKTKDWVTYVTL